MPTVGAFHSFYWRAHANAPPPPTAPGQGGYPLWQSTVVMGLFWGWSGDFWSRLGWVLRLAWCLLWDVREAGHRAAVEYQVRTAPVAAVALPAWQVAWLELGQKLTEDQRRVGQHALTALTAPEWTEAQAQVRACAGTHNFSDPKMWQTYSRAMRSNLGQAQNVYRHLKVVQALQAVHPTLPNPQAHLLVELAYQGFRLEGRPERRIIEHEKRILAHPVLH